MKMTKTYAKSPAPAFDAVEDIKFYLGDKYDTMVGHIKPHKHHGTFALACSLIGIHGYPVKAWYEHFNGQDTWVELEED